MTFNPSTNTATGIQVSTATERTWIFLYQQLCGITNLKRKEVKKKMKKILAIVMALGLALAPTSFAATTLTDADLNNITAGDWVVIPSGLEAVDVYHSNNTLDLEDEAQSYIQAVNNANAVDSAIASQTNIASVTGAPSNNVAVNGTNKANIANYNPAEESSWFESSSKSISKGHGSSESSTFDLFESESKRKSSTESFSKTLVIDETLNISFAEASVSSTECKGSCEGDTLAAAVLLVDYDKDTDYSKIATHGKSFSSDRAFALLKTHDSSSKSFFSKSEEHEKGAWSRRNLSENNHLDLEDNSQVAIQAVSNLNAVGSGAAMQANIASNVAVNGTITHLNVANVANGF